MQCKVLVSMAINVSRVVVRQTTPRSSCVITNKGLSVFDLTITTKVELLLLRPLLDYAIGFRVLAT